MMTSESDGSSPRSDLAAHPAASRRERRQGGESSADVAADVPAPLQCFIADCPSSSAASPGKVFFKLPAERDRCQQWLKICKREDLIGMPTPCINSYVICSDHFIKGYFKDASKAVLKNLAVPTVFDTLFIDEMELAEGSVENVEFEVAETDDEYDDADSDFDSLQLCRLCGSHSQNVVYIFSATGSNLKIASKINSILPITVNSSDHLPKQVCLSCLTKLDTSKDLFEMCLRVDERLKYLARKKLFRSHPCNKDSQAGTSHSQNSIKMENMDGVDRSLEHMYHLPTNDQPGKVTSGTCNSDSRKGNCDLISEVVISDSYICPFNCGGVMVAKSATLDCENEENKNVVVKDCGVTGETTVTHASDESNSLVPRNSVTVSEISPNVVYELRDDHGRKYTMSEPFPEWWHRGANIDNLEIIIHTLDPNFKLEDDEAPAEIQEFKEVDTKAYQVSYEAFPNLQLLAEHSKGHADSTCLCTLCMVRFESPAELASHMAGHRGNDKKMTKIAGSRRFGCSLCLRKFNNEKTWRRHSCNPSDCKPIRCPICMKSFQTEERLAFHQKFHNGAKPNYCEKCSKHFDNESLLYYHCSLVHEGDRLYACNLCKKRFFSNTRLTAHKRVHTGERPYECKECKSRFYDKETLKRHHVTHMSIKPFQCELCGILCGRKSLLRQHIQVHHLTPDHLKRGHSLIHYYCKLCDKTFTGSRDVLTHRDTHWHIDKPATGEVGSVSSPPPLICEFCAECFSNLSVLAKHRKEAHGDEKPYICSVCKLSSHTLHEARVHRRTHTTVDGNPKATSEDVTAKENTFMCEECGVQLSGCGNLRAHMKLHKQEALHKCGKCDRTFSNKHKLLLHSRLHSGEKPFACQQCGKRFSQSSALHIHILLHTGEKPHLCDLCGASFRIKADRDNHRRTHTGEKPYRCEYCFKEFRTGQVYYQHRMIHTGERRFPCDICGKAFKRSHTLVVHKRIHTGEKPNICDVCGKGFRQRTDMRKHRALHAHR